MAYFIGVILALTVSVFARVVGLDRGRAFYFTVLVVVASYYDLFAVMGVSTRALIAELTTTGAFLIAVVLGFKRNLWIVVVALAAHGLFDVVHPHLVVNHGVPAGSTLVAPGWDYTVGGQIGSAGSLLKGATASSAVSRDDLVKHGMYGTSGGWAA